MPSTFFGLNIAYSGLTASNAALNTTANNISNVNTEGYSRQKVTQQAYNSIRTYTTYGCVGAGVDTTAIERQRDVFYDFKYWDNNAQLGEYSELQYYMKQIEDYFRDDSTVDGFSTIFNKMYTTVGELMKNSGDSTTKAQFVGFAQNLTYYFNTMAQNLENMQIDVNSEIKNKIGAINSFAAEIASLNKQINVIEVGGGMANELRDQRDLIIDKLSKIVDTTTSEQPVYDTTQDPPRETGATRYLVKIAGGQTLVDTYKYNELTCEAKPSYANNNQSDAIGLYNIYWNDGRDFSVYSKSIGGELRGLIEMRDGNNGENFKGIVEDVTKNADGKTVVSIDVTKTAGTEYLKDLSKCTLPIGGGIINLGNQEFYFDDFGVTYGNNGNIESYQFVISDDPDKNKRDVDPDRVGREASVGVEVEYQGIPYYQEQMNEWVRLFAEAFNAVVTQEGSSNGHGDLGSDVFVANSATGPEQFAFTDAAGWIFYDGVLRKSETKNGTTIESMRDEDGYYRLTAKNFDVNRNMINDPQLLATRTIEQSGVSKYNIVDQLLSLKTDQRMVTFRGCGAGDFLQCMLSDCALNAQSANIMTESYTSIAGSIDNQRLSISGVDSDEEALNLVQYQHSYNLASKMIQTLSEIYDRLILETGV